MRLPFLCFVERLLDGQLKQVSANNAPLCDVIHPEFSALARMFGHCLAILTTHGNLEYISQRRNFHRVGRCRATATTTTACVSV